MPILPHARPSRPQYTDAVPSHPPVSRLGSGLRLLARLVAGERRRAADLYTLVDHGLLCGERTRYLNLGWWDGATTFDDACDALAEQVGLAAGMTEGDTVLDLGFGFGDQDEYWLRRFRPARIVGLNVTPLHVEVARRRFPDPRLEFRLGSATAIPLQERSVDRVTALECAFHFATRADFFRQARRVLRPGGGLATTDILPCPGPHPLVARLTARVLRAVFQVPPDNWYGADAYRRELVEAGFVDVVVRPVRDTVIVPYWDAVRRLRRDPEGRKRLNVVVRQAGRIPTAWFAALDYVLASARAPSAASGS